MTRRELFTVAAWAVASAGVSLAMFTPVPVGALDESQRLVAKVATPTLNVEGCRLQLRPKGDLAANQQPEFELVATNPTRRDATLSCTVTLNAAEPASRMSRMMPRSMQYWRHEQSLYVKAGETRALKLSPSTAVPAGMEATVLLTAGGQTVVAASFTSAMGAVQSGEGDRLVRLARQRVANQ